MAAASKKVLSARADPSCRCHRYPMVPSGKLYIAMENHRFLMGKHTINGHLINSFLYVYQSGIHGKLSHLSIPKRQNNDADLINHQDLPVDLDHQDLSLSFSTHHPKRYEWLKSSIINLIPIFQPIMIFTI